MALDLYLRKSSGSIDVQAAAAYLLAGGWITQPDHQDWWHYLRATTGVNFDIELTHEVLHARINYVRPPYWILDCLEELMGFTRELGLDLWRWENAPEERIGDHEEWAESLYDGWQGSNLNAALAVFSKEKNAEEHYHRVTEDQSWYYYDWNDFVGSVDDEKLTALPMRYVRMPPMQYTAFTTEEPRLQTYAFGARGCRYFPLADLYAFYQDGPADSEGAVVLPQEHFLCSPHLERVQLQLSSGQMIDALEVKDDALFDDWLRNGSVIEDPTTAAVEPELVLPEHFFSGEAPDRVMSVRYEAIDAKEGEDPVLSPWIPVGPDADKPS